MEFLREALFDKKKRVYVVSSFWFLGILNIATGIIKTDWLITKCIDFTQAVLFIALANLITVMYRKKYKVQKSEFREEKASWKSKFI